MDDRLDGRLLIGCGLKPKTITKNLVVLHGDLKGLPRSGSALRIECQELGRSVAGLLGRTTAGLFPRSEEHTSELQSRGHLVCRLLLEKKKKGGYETMDLIRGRRAKTMRDVTA